MAFEGIDVWKDGDKSTKVTLTNQIQVDAFQKMGFEAVPDTKEQKQDSKDDKRVATDKTTKKNDALPIDDQPASPADARSAAKKSKGAK